MVERWSNRRFFGTIGSEANRKGIGGGKYENEKTLDSIRKRSVALVDHRVAGKSDQWSRAFHELLAGDDSIYSGIR